EDAAKRAELALKADPKQAYDLLVRIALKRGDGQGALALFQRAVAAQAEPPGARRELALALSSDGRSAQALELLAPLGEPADPPTLCALATALSDAGRQGEAEAALRKALQKD